MKTHTSKVAHGSFTHERTFNATPQRVWQAFADPQFKAQWFSGPADKWQLIERSLDLRVGGSEVLHGKFVGGPETKYVARFHAIIENALLVYAYDMYHDGGHLSVSLSTVEMRPTPGDANRTLFTYTEYVTHLTDAFDTESRRHGTGIQMDILQSLVETGKAVVPDELCDAAPDAE